MSPDELVSLGRRDLPEDVVAELLRRWREPHRHYHGPCHLAAGLAVLDELGASRLERIAFWCHDAVHHSRSPADERASAELARRLLAEHLVESDLAEVSRLILITIDHAPRPADASGARIADADLWGLSNPWPDYARALANIRKEQPGLEEAQWRRQRIDLARRLLAREWIFHTDSGRALWEAAARANLSRELTELAAAEPPG